MPGMIQEERSSPRSNGNPHTTNTNSNSNSNSPPLQSFSEMSLASIRHAISSPYPQTWVSASGSPELKAEERGLRLIELLGMCANHVSAGNMEQSNLCMEQISNLASLTGDPMQRLATYFMEGLAARITKAWRGLHRALNSTHLPSIVELVSARQVFYSLFPYFRFAMEAVNLMILEAMQGEKVVHVIDLDASEPAQWIELLRLLRRREEGPPHLKITGIHEKREVLQQTAARLTEEAERLDIPFQFIQVVTRLENLTDDMLNVKTGDAVAISSVLQLHVLLAEDDRPGMLTPSPSPSHGHGASPSYILGQGRRSPQPEGRLNGKRPREVTCNEDLLRSMFTQYRNPPPQLPATPDRTLGDLLEMERSSMGMPMMSPSAIEAVINSRRSNVSAEDGNRGGGRGGNVDRFLQMMRGLSPKMMVVVEQESNHNSARLDDRLSEALNYYAAMFDCLESVLPQHCIERVTLEKHMFGQQIENIVACEGGERVERHEKVERWMKRLHRVGFALVPLSYATVMHAQRLVHTYSCDSYRIQEDRGCLMICWQDRPLYTVSAWQS
ncbi:hypothetical protein SUGI_0921300 [Cryptomeria japonica]|uniref:scarecrow-like protein 3 n=1 Tax=Cryptomeria japonica TaxID=3369 RepID=UPI0024146A4E|nr:scarecrow-like protein 3 [Cryptomeria japonica]GLJ44159.1 hypothetical protein SUGI_0921300 [Cryptomeria japonica]